MKIKVEEIRAGDRFVASGLYYWTAVADSGEGKVLDSDDETLVTLPVRFKDGGYGVRVWDPGTEIEVERPVSPRPWGEQGEMDGGE